jgi:hypothetical protein
MQKVTKEDERARKEWEACSVQEVDARYSERISNFLIPFACERERASQFRIRGLLATWLGSDVENAAKTSSPIRTIRKNLAAAFLDESRCASSNALTETDKELLRTIARE